MEVEITPQLIFILASMPFGLAALWYGYKGYKATKWGLTAYTYFLFALIGLGNAVLLDLFRLLGLERYIYIKSFMEIALFVAAVCFLLAFRDMYRFLSSTRSGE
jgi:hypothetical protein